MEKHRDMEGEGEKGDGHQQAVGPRIYNTILLLLFFT